MKKSTMKNLIGRMVVVLLAAAALLGACAQPTPTPAPTQPAAIQPTVTPAEKVIKVGIEYVGPINDMGWSQRHHEDFQVSAKRAGFKVEIVGEMENLYNPADIERVAEDLIRKGANLIISTAENHEAPLEAVVKRHPEVKFLQLHGHNHLQENPLPNWATYWGRNHESSALAALALCSMLKEGDEVGFMGAYRSNAQVLERLNGSKIGCDACGREVLFRANFIEDWVDGQKASIATQALLSFPNIWGIIQHHDTTDAMKALSSKRGEKPGERSAIGEGYDSDMRATVGDEQIITSAVWHWDVIYDQVLRDVYNDTFSPKHYTGGLKEGVVGLAPWSNIVPPAVRELVAAKQQAIINGKWIIFKGPLWRTVGPNRQKVLWVSEGKVLTDPEIYDLKVEDVLWGIITTER